jgi:hypothetical protein
MSLLLKELLCRMVCLTQSFDTTAARTNFRAYIAPAITGGSVVFDAFRGLWSREKATIGHRSDVKDQ